MPCMFCTPTPRAAWSWRTRSPLAPPPSPTPSSTWPPSPAPARSPSATATAASWPTTGPCSPSCWPRRAPRLLELAAEGGEPTWRLPLPPEYRKDIESDLADLKNVGDRYGGALFAGLFLGAFVAGRPRAHLDIAGPARAESDDGYLTKGSTGVTVRTLLTWLARRGANGLPTGREQPGARGLWRGAGPA